jgi:hypothetical protein
MYNDIVRILEIRYIQEMKKNLISLSLLDFQGSTIIDSANVLYMVDLDSDFI